MLLVCLLQLTFVVSDINESMLCTFCISPRISATLKCCKKCIRFAISKWQTYHPSQKFSNFRALLLDLWFTLPQWLAPITCKLLFQAKDSDQ